MSLPEFSNTNTTYSEPEFKPNDGLDSSYSPSIQDRSTFELVGNAWNGLSPQQKRTGVIMTVLVFALPLIIGMGVLNQQLLNQKAAEPITPPVTIVQTQTPVASYMPTPIPSIMPTATATATPTPKPTPTPAPICYRGPNLVLDPASYRGMAGDKFNIIIFLTNANTPGCTPVTYTLTPEKTTNSSATISPSTPLVLKSGETANIVMTTTIDVNAPIGRHTQGINYVASNGSQGVYFLIIDVIPKPVQVLQNGSFELQGADSKTPQSWVISTASSIAGRDCTNASMGNCSFQYKGKVLQNNTISQKVQFAGKKTMKYNLHFATKATKNTIFGFAVGSLKATVNFYDSANKLVGSSQKSISLPNHNFTDRLDFIVGNAPEDFSSVEVVFTYFSPIGTTWVDNVMLYIDPNLPGNLATSTPTPVTPAPQTPTPRVSPRPTAIPGSI